MKVIIYLFILGLLTLPIMSQLVGGYSVKTDNAQDQGLTSAKNLITTRYPFLANTKLVSVQTQVVAGTNYKLTYQDQYQPTLDKYIETYLCQKIMIYQIEPLFIQQQFV